MEDVPVNHYLFPVMLLVQLEMVTSILAVEIMVIALSLMVPLLNKLFITEGMVTSIVVMEVVVAQEKTLKV
jgi:hypothetical protein